jgi:hypothetical protein
VTHEFETVYLHFKNESRIPICIGDFYGDPECAIISLNENFVAMGGCGIIVYFLREPFEEYSYDKISAQFYEFNRSSNDIWWVGGLHQYSSDDQEKCFRFFVEGADSVHVYQANVDTKEKEQM